MTATRLQIALAALALAGSFTAVACTSTDSAAPEKILLISIDTTRSDRLSAYGYERPTTPALAEIAARGARFARAYAPMPTTDPSHASMLTGQYPRTHGIVRNAARRRDPKAPTLASWLAERGYETAAITARLGLDPPLRGIRGFSHSDAPVLPEKWRTAAEIVARVKQWLSGRAPDERWFLWAHLWEPHKPYDPPPALQTSFAGDHVVEPRHKDPPRFVPPRKPVPAAAVNVSRDLYDGEIRAADDAVRAIVEAARAAPPHGIEPLLVVVSDHGESLAERQRERGIAFGHGTLLYDEVVRVPWIVEWAGRVPTSVIQTPVCLVDLAPTLIGLVSPGASLPEAEGRDLSPYLRSRQEPPPAPFVLERRLFSSRARSRLAWPELAWVEWPWKLIVNNGVDSPELYHLERDPHERRNLAEQESETADRLRAKLTQWQHERPLVEGRGPSSREREALRSLGYLD